MVLLIAGPPVEVGVTMYVLSISSVSEVLMVQFAFKLIQTRHRQLPVHLFRPVSRTTTLPSPIPLVSIKKRQQERLFPSDTAVSHRDGTLDRNVKIVSML